MNNRVFQNPAYGYGNSNFGAMPTVNGPTAAASVVSGAVVGAIASALFIGSDVAKSTRLRAMVSPTGSVAMGAYVGAGAGGLIALALYAFQQGA